MKVTNLWWKDDFLWVLTPVGQVKEFVREIDAGVGLEFVDYHLDAIFLNTLEKPIAATVHGAPRGGEVWQQGGALLPTC